MTTKFCEKRANHLCLGGPSGCPYDPNRKGRLCVREAETAPYKLEPPASIGERMRQAHAQLVREGKLETPADVINDELRSRVDALPIALVPKREKGKPQLLAVVDSLREKIESGEIVAFAAVGIQADDVTLSWQGCTQGVTNLRLVGAVARLLHGVHTDIDG